MIAVDTNVLVRLLVGDDEDQATRAAALFEGNEIHICKTVLLETEWVLRFSYELDGAAILRALRGLAGLPQVTIEDGPAVAESLDLLEAGMDLADALHVTSGRGAAQFATFDKRLQRRADALESGRRRHAVICP
ncbi:MAG: type II toxin-antitoxin system VapC family toxin [Actinobacteria bacterium]|nr:type II toxin-antitoxin system VapC family toxin [Actinomycetota bacterium]